jgi:hypothetical protein
MLRDRPEDEGAARHPGTEPNPDGDADQNHGEAGVEDRLGEQRRHEPGERGAREPGPQEPDPHQLADACSRNGVDAHARQEHGQRYPGGAGRRRFAFCGSWISGTPFGPEGT